MASCHLDPKTRAFARLGASVALGANTSGFQSDVDAALAAGASVGEVVGVLIAVAPTVGVAKLVLAAPALGLAIGYDTDAGLGLLEAGVIGTIDSSTADNDLASTVTGWLDQLTGQAPIGCRGGPLSSLRVFSHKSPADVADCWGRA